MLDGAADLHTLWRDRVSSLRSHLELLDESVKLEIRAEVACVLAIP